MRPFRFGVNLLDLPSAAGWASTCRRAEQLGYDVLQVPDHLGWPAPFPALVAAAAVSRLRVGTFVLNAGFYRPELLAREIATTDRLTGGRLELGLGTGYVDAEFAAAGIDLPPGGPRVDHLERVVDRIRHLLADPATTPATVQQPVPLLIGGNGDRMLRLAAARADIVAFTAAAADPEQPGGLRMLASADFAERVTFFEVAAGERGAHLERNLLIQQVVITDDRDEVLHEHAAAVPYLRPEQLADAPVLLIGTVAQIADQVRRLRADFGISYLSVLQPAMEAFGSVIPILRAE